MDSQAYQWFVRFKYMPMASQLETDVKCFYDLEMAFWQNEVVGWSTCALESVEDVRRFMKIRFLGQFM